MQSQPTENMNKKIQTVLDYLHTYKDKKICFYCSDMKLHVDSNAAYLVALNAKSRIAGHFYCSDNTTTNPVLPPLNGLLQVECKVLQYVVTLTVEAKTAGLFYNCQTTLYLQQMLILTYTGTVGRTILLTTTQSTTVPLITKM